MTLTFDLEGQGHILFSVIMWGRCQNQLATAESLQNIITEVQSHCDLDYSIDLQAQGLNLNLLNQHSEFHRPSKCQTLVIVLESLYRAQ